MEDCLILLTYVTVALWFNLLLVDSAIASAEFRNLTHQKVAYLLICPHTIFLRDEFCQVELLPELNPNLRTAEPVSQNLLHQIIAEACDEYRNDLRVRILDQFANARLRAQERVRIVIEITRAFGMETDHITRAFAGELNKTAH